MKKNNKAIQFNFLVYFKVAALICFASISQLLLASENESKAPVVYKIPKPEIFTGDLRNLPKASRWLPGEAIKDMPRRRLRPDFVHPGKPVNPVDNERDPLLNQQENVQLSAKQLRGLELAYAGQGYSGVNPPDPSGDVGRDYYIQMINGSGGALFTIYDKNTGNLVAGPTSLDSLGSRPCNQGLGDPIVLYDEMADRWLLSEFSNRQNNMCVYISQTNDPITGGWYSYNFKAPSFPDYPKYAVWNNAYFVSTNESSTAAYALDRASMLAGQSASFIRLTVPDLAGFGFQALQPADHDGLLNPPTGSPGIFLRHRDDEVHNSGNNDNTRDFVELWAFNADFANTSNASLNKIADIPVAEFSSDLCGLTSFSCIPQPGTSTTLDPLREVVMFRAQYRNSGTHETIVGNFVTDVDGNDHAGIRWFELRKSGGSWSLFQEGTYAPDSHHRWMGSIAMDGDGNIALGYSVSSSSLNPGLRYNGRLSDDPLGVLTLAETTLVNGTSNNSSNRWGDYSHLALDPVDHCTFWYTNEFGDSNGRWGTHISRFKFDSCGGGTGGNQPPVADFSYSCTDLSCSFDGTTSSDSDGTISSYSWDFADSTTATGSTANHDFAAAGTYNVSLMVTDNEGASATSSQNVTVAVGGANIVLSGSGTKVRGLQKVDLSWSGATSNDVDVYRDGNLIATTANDGSYRDNVDRKGGGSYVYELCEAGTSVCSNTITVSF